MKFHVPDMSCNHCVASITKAIHSLSADAHVVCDLSHRNIEVADGFGLSPDRLIATLGEIGFEATLIEAQV
jgi:copper chaperone